jgi:hypothetical protein
VIKDNEDPMSEEGEISIKGIEEDNIRILMNLKETNL